MKKRTLIFAISTAVVICSPSCKKDAASADNPDSWYQAQLESTLNLHKEASSGQQVTTITNVNFATYKEAYETFKSLSTNQATAGAQLVEQSEPSTLQGYIDFDGILATYFAYCNYSMPIKSSLDPGSIGLSFKVEYDIDWTSTTDAFVEQNYPINCYTSYAGPGTIKSNGQPTVHVTPNAPTANAGQINGQVQITGTIKGDPFSVLVTIVGFYSYTIPTQFLGTSIVTYGATATGSL